MATANYVMIDGVPHSPLHPKALALQREQSPQLKAHHAPDSAEHNVKRGTAKRIRQSNEINHRSKISNPKPECNQAPILGSAISGEEQGVDRIIVRFVGKRVRPLDPDNFAGSCKDLLDGLRHAGLIPGDEPWRIKLETEQVKVRTSSEEKTVIEIEYP